VVFFEPLLGLLRIRLLDSGEYLHVFTERLWYRALGEEHAAKKDLQGTFDLSVQPSNQTAAGHADDRSVEQEVQLAVAYWILSDPPPQLTDDWGEGSGTGVY